MPTPELFLTADGSHSLRLPATARRSAVTYHSRHGAIQESHHIFIRHGLLPVLEAGPARVRVLELGFGTGLNTLLTRLEARHHPGTHFHYLTYEPQPVPVAVVGNLNYAKQLGEDAGALSELHECPWNECQALDPNFSFTKLKAEFSAPSPTPPADLLYFDAFAPEDQPELWTVETLRLASDRLRPGGRLLTYCAKGQFKRNLRALGYRVEALPGPPGKREITRAIRCPFGSFGHRMSVKMS